VLLFGARCDAGRPTTATAGSTTDGAGCCAHADKRTASRPDTVLPMESGRFCRLVETWLRGKVAVLLAVVLGSPWKRSGRRCSVADAFSFCSVTRPPALPVEGAVIGASEDGFGSRERQPKPRTSPSSPRMPAKSSIGGLPRDVRRRLRTGSRGGLRRSPFVVELVSRRRRIMISLPSKLDPGWLPTHNCQPYVRVTVARYFSVFPMPESVRPGRTLTAFTVATLMRHLPGRMFRSRNRYGPKLADQAVGGTPLRPHTQAGRRCDGTRLRMQ
jgi:hypothetical protein